MSQRQYEIDKIVDRKLVNGRMRLLVKWKNYPNTENTWVFEDEIPNSDDEDTELPSTSGTSRTAAPTDEIESKFVSTDKVLRYIRSGRKIEGNRNNLLKAVREHPGGTLKDEGLFIYLKDRHFYVILKHSTIGNYICDGANLCKPKSKKLKEMEKELGLKLTYIADGQQQAKEYHCGAHAIWLALNILADTKNGNKPDLVINKRIPSLHRFINRLYNE